MISKNSPIVQEKAKSGVQWAVALASGKPWSSLSPGQKRAANKAAGTNGVSGGRLANPQSTKVVSAPVARAMRMSNPSARIRTAGKTTTITHCEYLGRISSNAGTGLQYLSRTVNPSSLQTFPWLSTIAAGYEKYKFTRVALRYTSSCPTSTSGKVILAYDYDSSDALPPDVASIYNSEGHLSLAPWDSALMEFPTDSIPRFISDNSTSDPKLVDLGKLLVCNYGQLPSDPATIGEVFVEYTVLLMVPQPTASTTQQGNRALSVGPQYITAALIGNNWVLTMNAPGRYFVWTLTEPDPVGATLSQFESADTLDDAHEGTYSWIVTSSSGTGTITMNNSAKPPTRFLYFVSRLGSSPSLGLS